MAQNRIEINDVRMQRILPYLANPTGITLDDLMILIDSKLKDASPDNMAPGLINWSNKDLFVDKWIRLSGTGLLNYNGFGLSKIGKGRYEISGTGLFEYDRYLPVSDTRGVTGKIYIGSNALGAIATVGVRCYDANKNYLGTNGGFLCNSVSPSTVNTYSFYKASAFGESASGLMNLKPNTRFIKLYIEVSSNPGILFFDESEMTTFELDERYLQFFGTNIDWNTAEFFYTEVLTNTTFTFTNDQDGRVRTFFIKNTGPSNINVNFPSAKWQGGVPLTLIRSGKLTAFTFVKAGGIQYASVIEELE